MKRDHDDLHGGGRHQQQQQQQRRQQCGECGAGAGERWLLHNVRHKAGYRLLCTHCVLSCFRGNFCPICLQVFDPIDSPPHPNQRVMCLNCPSISHLSCVTSSSNPNYHFECPFCSNPKFRFLSLGPVPSNGEDKRLRVEANAGLEAVVASRGGAPLGDDRDDVRRVIDRESAKALVAAAKIACATMSKAAAIARVEAERRVKEAALARKRAREALERVAFLTLKEKERDLKVGVANGVGFAPEHKVKPRVVENEKVNQGVDGILGSSPTNGVVSVAGGVQGEKLHSVSPVAGLNNVQQNNFG
ncbi:uncharacterized protein LOC115687472 [Syzygium oleosum]|uniref:uncharacterized protein LOC115687472 n=1 Tax=Syzygium oleosum TaxID=219896 RepID=UPI0024BA5E92|nr:uncharacterized protein LOC115687472 [Syzygium oleosum]